MNQPHEGNKASGKDLKEDHEQPVREEEMVRPDGYILGQGAANLPHPRAAKVERWRKTEPSVHTTVGI